MALFTRLLALGLTGWFFWVFIDGGVLHVGDGEIPVMLLSVFFVFIFGAFLPRRGLSASGMTFHLEMSLLGSLAMIVTLGALSMYAVAVQNQREGEARKQAEIAAMPKWHVAKGVSLSDTIMAWRSASSFGEVHLALGDYNYVAEVDLDLAAPDFCGALKVLGAGFKDAKPGISVACRKSEGVAMVATKGLKTAPEWAVDVANGRCAIFKPAMGGISVRKGECSKIAASVP